MIVLALALLAPVPSYALEGPQPDSIVNAIVPFETTPALFVEPAPRTRARATPRRPTPPPVERRDSPALEGLQHFSSVVACDSTFQIQQIAAGVASVSPRHHESRSVARDAAIGHQIDFGVCRRLEDADYLVLNQGSFTYGGVTLTYYEATSATVVATTATYVGGIVPGVRHIYLLD